MPNLITAKEVLERLPWWSLPTLYHHSRTGHFVAPVKLGGKRLWPADEVDAWIAERLARDADRNTSNSPTQG